MTAIVSALLEWRALLLSVTTPFKVVTDHRGLEYFMSTSQLNRRQARWSERLADFDFKIEYRPGNLNDQADALSRRDDVNPLVGDASYAEKENTRPFFQDSHLRAAITIHKPDTLLDDIRTAQHLDPEIASNLANATLDTTYSIVDDLLHFNGSIIVPDNDALKLRILQSRHDHPTAGHPGRTKTQQLVRRDFFWKGIANYVTNYVKACTTCIRTKLIRHKRYGYLQPLPIPY